MTVSSMAASVLCPNDVTKTGCLYRLLSMLPMVTTLFSSLVSILKSTFLLGSYSESTVPVEGVVVWADADVEAEDADEEELLLQEANVRIKAKARIRTASFFMTSSDV